LLNKIHPSSIEVDYSLDVLLSSDSFIGIISAAIEGYKSEVGGLLFGDRIPSAGKFVVKLAIPLQTTRRTLTNVRFHLKRTDRVLRTWDYLTVHWPLGTFHSHPEGRGQRYKPIPSKSDTTFLSLEDIDVIIAIWESPRHKTFRYTHNNQWIAGSAGSFYIQLAAWHYPKQGGFESIDVWCPYFEIINLAYEVGLTNQPGRLFWHETVTPNGTLRKLHNLVHKYENIIFKTLDYEAGEPVLQQIKEVLKRIQTINQ
jgi:proteasome lid subunit RPN8/RPN11